MRIVLRFAIIVILGGVLLFFLGRWVGKRIAKKATPPKKKMTEQEMLVFERKKILAQAEKNHGRLTMAEAYLISDLDEAKLKKMFDSLMQDDVCRMEVDAQGNIVYSFHFLA